MLNIMNKIHTVPLHKTSDHSFITRICIVPFKVTAQKRSRHPARMKRIVLSRDVNRKPEIWFSIFKPKTGSIYLATGFRIYFLSFSSRKSHKNNYQMSDKIN